MSRRRRATYRELIAQLRERRDNCAVHDMTFEFAVNQADRKAVGERQQKRFLAWWDTWVEPTLRELDERLAQRKGGQQ